MALALDTLRIAHRLQEAGMPQKQAEALAEVTHNALVPQVVTKEDLRGELNLLEQRLTHAITRQTIALGGLVAAGVAFLAFSAVASMRMAFR